MKLYTLTHEIKTVRKFEVRAVDPMAAKEIAQELGNTAKPDEQKTTERWICEEGHTRDGLAKPQIFSIDWGDPEGDGPVLASHAHRIWRDRHWIALQKIRNYTGPVSIDMTSLRSDLNTLKARASYGLLELEFICDFETDSTMIKDWGIYHLTGEDFIEPDLCLSHRTNKAWDFLERHYQNKEHDRQWKARGNTLEISLRQPLTGRRWLLKLLFKPCSDTIGRFDLEKILKDREVVLTEQQRAVIGDKALDISPRKMRDELNAERVEIAEKLFMNCQFDGMKVEKAGTWESIGGDNCHKALEFRLKDSPYKYVYRVWFQPWTSKVTLQKYEKID